MFEVFLRCIPFLWILGALTPASALMLVKLAAERWPRGFLVNVIVWSWFSIALSQAAAAILNGVAIDNPATGLANAFGFGVVGWIFGGLAIAAGAAYRLDDPRTIRATALVGLYILILAAIAAVGHLAGRRDLYIWPTPAEILLPSSPSVTFYTAALVFQTEETLGEATTRLVLFFPWAPALGLGGLAVAFISLLERNFAWRLIGFAGGVVGVVFSWSRIAIAALIAVGALLAFLRLPRIWRLAIVGAGLCALFVLPLYGIDPLDQVSQIQDRVNGARAGSSLARELIYQKSFEGFLQSPLIGHGWIGESVHAKETLPIGSHSTIYGLLYTGGAPTFAAFAVAMLLTFAGLVWRYVSIGANDPRRSHLLVGVGLALCLAAYCRYEALFNLTLPCIFLFSFIGAALATPHPTPNLAAAQVARRSSRHRSLTPAGSFAARRRALQPHPLSQRRRAFDAAPQTFGD
jgi:hypothetical protein